MQRPILSERAAARPAAAAHGIMRRVMPQQTHSRRITNATRADVAVEERERRSAAIIAVVRDIPRGRVTTYGAVAARAGAPRQARLVGKVLASLPVNSSVPWQRVVAAGGRIAFPAGAPSRERQIARLRRDGVDATRGRVNLQQHGWGTGVGDLDQLLWSGE